MKCTGLSVASLLSLLVASAAAGDLMDDLGREFAFGLFPRQLATNLQAFSGSLGGAAAPAITKSSDPARPFTVDGDTFNDFSTAAQRACDNQKNQCADIANSQKDGSLKVGDCDQQNTQCKNAASTATTTSFATLTSSNAEFDFFCE
ncbi:hypothetical protein BKA67DRAFT_87743 [Truncatella angustata]|uniref:Uncharacterized protein n=1 Tax=Truncatella angustata TaxID=152316 RepID=A0A9P8U930_9PEZI|nr:uncharacterized protein BKA67DRAFT_87743 [Truncatella angustata]KAH6645844.1 hypothetical protein BKA67DRAFT_87743 [Truncatella angustata]KAH8201986.1 hypothetical protein TruAng_003829 [Truncatella angustata]